mmetsp:Transcript_9659/g.20030  ORF Transcript_9659/g.20030 Transcript_9659/m.20030 type:complete len:349 (+) Transcript_9659:162-1208(+)
MEFVSRAPAYCRTLILAIVTRRDFTHPCRTPCRLMLLIVLILVVIQEGQHLVAAGDGHARQHAVDKVREGVHGVGEVGVAELRRLVEHGRLPHRHVVVQPDAQASHHPHERHRQQLHGAQHADVHQRVQHVHRRHPQLEDDVGVAVGLLQHPHGLLPAVGGGEDEEGGEVHTAVCVGEHQEVLEGDGGGEAVEHKGEEQHHREDHPREHHRPRGRLRVLRAHVLLHGLLHGMLVLVKQFAGTLKVLGVLGNAWRYMLLKLLCKRIICGVKMIPKLLAEMLTHVPQGVFQPEFLTLGRGHVVVRHSIQLLQHAGINAGQDNTQGEEHQPRCSIATPGLTTHGSSVWHLC